MARGPLLAASLLALLALAPALTATHAPGPFSRVSTPGPYGILLAEDLDFYADDGTRIDYGLWRPDVPAGAQVPVLVTAGPYFSISDTPTNVPAARLGSFLIENFVPHGYAVAQVSIRGTAKSGGCMELMSLREARDLDQLVTHLATRPWSNGNVGMAGKSYDGSTPWMVARLGNPHLKTIVPIAGVTDQGDLLFHNGTSEARGPFFHSEVYWPYGFDDTRASDQDRLANANCPEAWNGTLSGPLAYATGWTTSPAWRDWFDQRAFREGVLQNYAGSVFVVHGLWDWNVDPHQVVPFFSELQVPKKLWLGQWGHHYPDRASENPQHALRMDFADVLLPWFDRWLRGAAGGTGPAVEVQGLDGTWHVEASFPPATTAPAVHYLTGSALQASPPPAGGATGTLLLATQGYAFSSTCDTMPGAATWATPGFHAPQRYAGSAQLNLTVRTATGGNLYGELCLQAPWGGRVLLSKAELNLLYAQGGREPQPFTPGVPFPARLVFLPQDFTVPQGWRLVLNLYHDAGSEPLPNPASAATSVLRGPGMQSTLTLPAVPS